MGKIFRKNQVIITALAVMIAVAGYLNFSGKELSEYGLGTDEVETAAIQGADASATPEAATDISAEDMGEDSLAVADSGEALQEGKDETKEEDAKKDADDASDEDGNGDNKTADKENPGAAVLVSSMNAGYFSSAKISREQTRAQNKETLMAIVNNEKLSTKEKKKAVNSVVRLTEEAEKENNIETVLGAKGFDNVIVTISDGKAEVIVGANDLTEQQIAQIEDVIKRSADIAPENIVITPVGIREEN